MAMVADIAIVHQESELKNLEFLTEWWTVHHRKENSTEKIMAKRRTQCF